MRSGGAGKLCFAALPNNNLPAATEGVLMHALARIRWLAVLLGALLVELVLFVLVVPLHFLPNGDALILRTVIPVCFVVAFTGGVWIARRAGTLFVLHGLLLGIVATLMYAALTWNKSLPLAYVVSNYLKVVAGAAGGFVAQRMARGSSQRPA